VLGEAESGHLREKSRKKIEISIAFIAMSIFAYILLNHSCKINKNITGFMVIGDHFKAPQFWTPQTLVHQGSVGYDGQFYYYIAHDPFILGQTYHHIDSPAYRYQRIIYPLTSWLLSLGQPKWIPYAMVAVNLFAIVTGTWFILLILRHYHRSPWYGLLYAGFWGFLLCLLRSLPEPSAMAFVVIAVYCYLKGAIRRLAFFLGLAALTQETSLLVSMSFLAAFFRKKERRSCLYLLFPFCAYGLWQLYLFSHFQTFSFLAGVQNFAPPFMGIIEKYISLCRVPLTYATMAEWLFLLMVTTLIFLALYDIIRYYGPLTLAFLGYALMTACFSQLIWVESWSYARANSGLLVFNLLVFIKEKAAMNLLPMCLLPVIFFLSLLSMGFLLPPFLRW
jgi:hypothetical protein